MLKRITTKESDIVNPLMAKVRASIKSSEARISICIRRLNSLLADGPNLTADVKRFRFLGIKVYKTAHLLGLSGFDILFLRIIKRYRLTLF
jgi:hypothetical protein